MSIELLRQQFVCAGGVCFNSLLYVDCWQAVCAARSVMSCEAWARCLAANSLDRSVVVCSFIRAKRAEGSGEFVQNCSAGQGRQRLCT